MEIKVKIIDPIGLHARPASQLVAVAGKFKSEITIEKMDGKSASLKSIISVMGLGVENGQEVKIIAKGKDEAEAIRTLEETMRKNELI